MLALYGRDTVGIESGRNGSHGHKGKKRKRPANAAAEDEKGDQHDDDDDDEHDVSPPLALAKKRSCPTTKKANGQSKGASITKLPPQ